MAAILKIKKLQYLQKCLAILTNESFRGDAYWNSGREWLFKN